jgi:hypothetical protein
LQLRHRDTLLSDSHVTGAATNDTQELGTRGHVVTPQSEDGARHHLCTAAAHTTQRHTQMLSLEHHPDAALRERPAQRVRDLVGQYSGLEPAREVLDHPCKLRESDEALARNVRNIRHADQRQQMMRAQRVERNATAR